jgi:antitoxin protein of toxin-antitoxin system
VDLGGLADKAKNALNSDKGEQQSDSALDKAEQFADQRSGGTHDAQIDKAREMADQHIGLQNPPPDDPGQPQG